MVINKISFFFICTMAIILMLAGCNNAAIIEGSSFKATVLENNQTSLLVEPEEGSAELSSADRMIVSVRDATLIDSQDAEMTASDFEVGKQVQIFYTGGIAESYPAQVQETYKIKLLD